MHNLYLQTAAPYSALTHYLKDYLQASHVHLADSITPGITILQIISENNTQQLLSVSTTQQTRQYNLILTVIYQLNDANGKPLIPAQTATETRVVTIQSDQILGGSNEANSLYQQMRQAIVFDIMNRLSSKDITQILSTVKAPHKR